jgi:nitrous oxidase accessory protein NosD
MNINNRRTVRFLIPALLLALSLPVGRASASTQLVVGSASQDCVGATYQSIQSAVDAASDGDSIRVCKGVYQEQLSITKSVDINPDEGVFLVPSVLKQNATGLATGVPIAAAIFVSGTVNVSISGMTVDGINNAVTGCAPRVEGIYYQNASGKISRNVVRNVTLGLGLGGCQSGTGILVESGNGGSSDVTIVDNVVHDFQKNGITANEIGTHVSVHGNVITGLGPTNGAAQNGIQIGFGAKGEISQNMVMETIWSGCTDVSTCSAVATQILVAESDGVKVSDNMLADSQVSIFIEGNLAEVSGNQVFNSRVFDGIRIEGSNCRVRHNKISTAGEALIFVMGNDNKVEHNALADAVIGILKSTGSLDNKFDHNDFDNVAIHFQDPPLNSFAGLIIPER